MSINSSPANISFLNHGGELGALMRAHDWSQVSLGAPENWPQSLKTIISLILNTKFPQFLWWGPELLCFYNDAYRPCLGKDGKHPGILGQPAETAWAEIWPVIKPLIDHVLAGQGATWSEDQLIPIFRNGQMEDVYWTFSYSPAMNEQGEIAGVLVTCTETTGKVMAVQQLRDNLLLTQESEERFRTMAEGTPRYHADGKFAGYISLSIDMTSRKIQEQDMLALNEETAASNEDLVATNEELTALQQTTGKLFAQVDASETQFRFMLNAIPQQVWTATPDGALNYVNQVVCDDFGYDTDEIVGQGWQEFIHPDDLKDCIAKWTHALQTGKEYLVEFRLKFKDSAYYWHLARAVPFTENDEIKLWLGTNTNIDLQKMTEQRKDEFLSIASHELKTPLTSIKAYNQIIQKITDPEKLKPFLKKSADHIDRLERLISDLLDVTKINAGRMNYVMEPVNFRQLLTDSIESVQQSAERHEIILESSPEIIYNGDQLRLEQVLHNFLTNAVKYSPKGKRILVNAKVDQDNIVVSVQDFGIGIARDSLDKLFDRYYRVDNTAMRFEGLGLGLFISAEILREHGGSFWIESEPGAGSTFFFRLPVGQLEKRAVARTATYYHDQHITVNFDKMHNRMDVDWTGFQDMETVKAGCLIMLDIMERNKCSRIVNDNSHVLGNWSEAAEWVGNIWFPMMEKSGLKYFAHVFSPSTFSQLSARKSIDIMNGIITTQYFTDTRLAKKWINGLD